MSHWTDPQFILFVGSALLAVILTALFIAVKAVTTAHPIIVRYKDEESYFNPTTKSKEIFPSIQDSPTISLSIVVPAYEEEKRLPTMLDECLEYLENRIAKDATFKYEVIIVSDGSKDKTVEVAHKYSERYTTDKVRVLALLENRGKGGAVRLGMQNARGRQLLFADADGATRFGDLDKLESGLNRLIGTEWQKKAIVIGSRAHLQDEAVASRSFFRTILMHGFHLLVWTFAVRGIRDTQCGFKLLTRSAAEHLFAIMHVERWAFDVEILYLAQTFGISIEEVAVNWTEIEGSKIVPIWSWLQMGRDLFIIWFRYSIGAWSLKRPKAHTQ